MCSYRAKSKLKPTALCIGSLTLSVPWWDQMGGGGYNLVGFAT